MLLFWYSTVQYNTVGYSFLCFQIVFRPTCFAFSPPFFFSGVFSLPLVAFACCLLLLLLLPSVSRHDSPSGVPFFFFPFPLFLSVPFLFFLCGRCTTAHSGSGETGSPRFVVETIRRERHLLHQGSRNGRAATLVRRLREDPSTGKNRIWLVSVRDHLSMSDMPNDYYHDQL